MATVSLARVCDPSRKLLYSSLGASLFILGLGVLDPLTRGALNLPALIPPFGASTVIVFFAPETPASRPWNVLVGHLGSALVASLVLLAGPGLHVPLQASLAVSGAALWMVLTRSIHPPGGATALLAVLAGRRLGAGSELLPIVAGCGTLVTTRWAIDLLARVTGATPLERIAAPAPERLSHPASAFAEGASLES